MKLDLALPLAKGLKQYLSPHCERVEIAGSCRRHKPDVKDIEIVAMPKPGRDIFGAPTPPDSGLITHALSQYPGLTRVKNGDRYKKYELAAGISLDLFIVLPPAQWGVIFAIRTGPAEYSRWLVTPRHLGGALPSAYHVRDGVVWQAQIPFSTPEESDFFELLGLPFPDPGERKPEWNKFK